jgi:hypothetical protein
MVEYGRRDNGLIERDVMEAKVSTRTRSWIDVVIGVMDRHPAGSWLVLLLGSLLVYLAFSWIQWEGGPTRPGASICSTPSTSLKSRTY